MSMEIKVVDGGMKGRKNLPFTPGPWVAEQGDVYGDDPTRWSVFTDTGDKKYFVATVENGVPEQTMKTEKGTARLIAAAPALLAACEELLARVESDIGNTPEGARARAAIAKATGANP